MSSAEDFWGPPIHVYTRAQALEDGTLVDVDRLVEDEPLFAHQAGFQVKVAMTARVAELVVPNDRERADGQDLKGRLWDLLNMARMYRPRSGEGERAVGADAWRFPCIFVTYRPDAINRVRHRDTTYHLCCQIHGGDEGEPVVTIHFPDED